MTGASRLAKGSEILLPQTTGHHKPESFSMDEPSKRLTTAHTITRARRLSSAPVDLLRGLQEQAISHEQAVNLREK
jgi:hypothetical protein